MFTNDSTLMHLLSTQMRYMSQRQGVLAQNIANADTPGYKAQDVKKPDFSKMATAEASGGMKMQSTSSKHLGGTLSGASAFAIMQDRESFETSPVGNNVVLEDQMAKISDTGAQFQIASTLLKKFTQMYRAALGNR